MRYAMTTEAIALPFPTAELSFQGIDLNDAGAWLAVVETQDGLRLRTTETDVNLSLNLGYAMVRWLGDKALVVFSRILEIGNVNAWVVDVHDGSILNCFSVGDGVQDVVVLEDFIVVSYFDEGVYSDNPISNEGISVFDLNGTFQWGYQTDVADPVMIDDCYAVCKIGQNRVTFCAYADFVLVELDLVTRQQIIFSVPKQLEGAAAITALPHVTLFHGPYDANFDHRKERTQVYAFDRASGAVMEAGHVLGKWVRGLSGGRMLAVTDAGLSVTRFSEQDGSLAAAI
jgi:hypothetical protein